MINHTAGVEAEKEVATLNVARRRRAKVFMCLDICAKSKLTVPIKIDRCTGDDSARAKSIRNIIGMREVI
jgi:hypothetical protein